MAVGAVKFPVMHPVKGFSLAAVAAGIKSNGKTDLVGMACCEGSTVVGLFTRNAFCAAPVVLAKQHLQMANSRLLITNSGNANAGTGQQGFEAASLVCQALAEQAGVRKEQVLPFSTGVIGEPLPADRIVQAGEALLAGLREDNWALAANGIMTTDTFPKGSSLQFALAGRQVTITGIAKGAGMIKPNMATMLAYVATDMAIAEADLQRLISAACERSFNRITVDGDTSTNDSLILVATGQGADFTELSEADRALFAEKLNGLFVDLAQQIIRDGEGATKFVSVVVEQGGSTDECLAVAYAIAESPLVKTALFASDPNWGRILAAVGRAGLQSLNISDIDIFLGDVQIVAGGARAASYTEQQGQAVMNQEEISIRVVLNRGINCETVWTTDLSYDYVKINAEYRS